MVTVHNTYIIFTKSPLHDSFLTYVSVGNGWSYICVLADLFNREIIGYSAEKNKNAVLVSKAFSRVETTLEKIQIFHTDRGNEFKNRLLDETLETFHIQRSLSMKDCPYDNAAAEATFKIIKTEFVKGQEYESLEQLQYELSDYVNCFNSYSPPLKSSKPNQKNYPSPVPQNTAHPGKSQCHSPDKWIISPPRLAWFLSLPVYDQLYADAL